MAQGMERRRALIASGLPRDNSACVWSGGGACGLLGAAASAGDASVRVGGRPGRGRFEPVAPTAHFESGEHSVSFWDGYHGLIHDKKLLARLSGASGPWFLMDFAYYGNMVSSPMVLSALGGDHTILQKTLTQLLIFTIFAVPGYAASAFGAAAIVSDLGIVATIFPLPEPKGKSLEEIGDQALTAVEKAAA